LNVTGDMTAAAYIQKVEDKPELKKLRLDLKPGGDAVR
jgi:hypothetical protein